MPSIPSWRDASAPSWADNLLDRENRLPSAAVHTVRRRDTTIGLNVIEEIAKQLPLWHLDAACRGEDPALFFLDRGQSATQARAICGRCPVLEECLDYAIDEEISEGVFGGLSPRQRRLMAETGCELYRGHCERCGAPFVTLTADETFCGLSCRMKVAFAAARA